LRCVGGGGGVGGGRGGGVVVWGGGVATTCENEHPFADGAALGKTAVQEMGKVL